MAITKPTVNGSSGTWGTILNQALDDLDTRVGAAVPTNTFTAKGDLLAGTGTGSGTGALARVPAGTNGRVLTADSTAAQGVSWQLAPGSLFFKARCTVTQNLADTTWTAMKFDTIDYDRNAGTGNAYTSLAQTYTPGVPGWYEATGAVSFALYATGNTQRGVAWAVNSTTTASAGTGAMYPATTGAYPTIIVARPFVFQIQNATDTISLMGFHNTGAALTTYVGVQMYQPSISLRYLGN